MHEQDVRVDEVLDAVLASGGTLIQPEAAEQFGGSPRTFRRALKGHTGLNYRTTRLRVKLGRARVLLRDPP